MCGSYIPPKPLPRKGWKTYTIGGLLAGVSAVLAFVSGVDWGVFFTAESAAVLGAGVVFGRAIVGWFQARGT